MCDELIADLRRHRCNAKEDDTQEVCDECPYDVIIADKSRPNGFTSVCVCGLMNRAADALEELQKRVPPVPHGRLVDADALMHEFEKAQRTMEQHGQEYSCSFMSSSQELSTEWYCVEDMLENAPTILEAEEAERTEEAEWTKDNTCSHCGDEACAGYDEEPWRTRFCPHCGAKMKNPEDYE